MSSKKSSYRNELNKQSKSKLKKKHILRKKTKTRSSSYGFKKSNIDCIDGLKPDRKECDSKVFSETFQHPRTSSPNKGKLKRSLSSDRFNEYEQLRKFELSLNSSVISNTESENEEVLVDKMNVDQSVKIRRISRYMKNLFSTYHPDTDSSEEHENLNNIFKTIKLAIKKSGLSQELVGSFKEEETVDVRNITENTLEISDKSENNISPLHEPKGTFKLFTANKMSLLVIDESSTVNFHGLMEVQVLFGTVEILGKSLNLLSPSTKVYSPRGSAFLTLKNKDISEILNTKKLCKDICNFGFPKNKVPKEDLKNIKSTSAVLLCKKIVDKKINFITHNISQVIFPCCDDNELQCEFWDDNDPERNVISENCEWEKIIDTIDTKSRVMLCGGKNVGKSTLLRYLVNRLLDNFDEVAVIDLDPGQAEFTIPGCISLVNVKMPIIGPNYTHISKPDRCIFIPNYDVRSSHETYLKCVKELLSLCEYNKIPTIVNYMGFTKDIGSHLVASVICEVHPTTVIQIDSHLRGKNFDADLTTINVNRLKNLLSKNVIAPNFKLLKISSMSKHSSWELEPRQTREMCILGYLGEILPEGCQYLTEKEVNVYRCSLSNIKLYCNERPCEPAAVNAKLVALCTERTKINDLSIYNCHGWGIVRGYSIELDVLILITPLEYNELEEIDHLIAGCVNLPPSVYLQNHKRVVGLVPYVYEGDLKQYAKNPKRNG